MSELPLWIAIAVKVVFAATVVVAATTLAERSGPLIGGLIIALPVSVGPTYVMLAVTTTSEFIAQSALGSLQANAGGGACAAVYVVLAHRVAMPLALVAALATWFGLSIATREAGLGLPALALLNVVVFAVALPLTRAALAGQAKLSGAARWYDMPLRALFVGVFAATLVTISHAIGPAWTGIMAAFPLVITTSIVLMHPRVGSAATAAAMATVVRGLIAYPVGYWLIHVGAVPWGAWWALLAALVPVVAWQGVVYAWRRRAVRG
ncbi:MAG: hypothetical protein ACKVQQ_00935 [Burkholderiales bacterium]